MVEFDCLSFPPFVFIRRYGSEFFWLYEKDAVFRIVQLFKDKVADSKRQYVEQIELSTCHAVDAIVSLAAGDWRTGSPELNHCGARFW
jgi:hypothetical protein